MAARTLKSRLIYRLVPAAVNAAMVALAMLDRAVGVGMLIGIGVSAVLSAIRDHRREALLAAEHVLLDQKLDSALAEFRRRGTHPFSPDPDSEDTTEHWS